MLELLACILVALFFVAVVYVPVWLYTRRQRKKETASGSSVYDTLLSRDSNRGSVLSLKAMEGHPARPGFASQRIANTTAQRKNTVASTRSTADDDRRKDDVSSTYQQPASTLDWGSSLSDSSSSSSSDSGSSSPDFGGGDFGGGVGGSDY